MAWSRMRVTTVGDVGVGKTSIFIRYTTNQFPDKCYPGSTFDASPMFITLTLIDCVGFLVKLSIERIDKSLLDNRL